MFHLSDEVSVAPTDFSSVSSNDHNPTKTKYRKRLFFSPIRKLLMGNLFTLFSSSPVETEEQSQERVRLADQATEAARVPGLLKDIARLEGIVTEQSKALSNLAEQVNQLTTDLTARIDQLETRNEELETRNEEIETRNEELETTIVELRTIIANTSPTSSAYDADDENY